MGAEDSTLGLIFEIAADPSKAINATESFRDQAGKAMRDFEEQMMSTMTKSLGITKEFALGMAIGTGAVVGLGVAMFELADKAAEVGAKIFEVHEKTDLSAESLSGLMALTKQTGENFDSLSTALARAGLNLEKAIIDPSGKAAGILSQVMGSSKELADLGLKPMDERLQDVLKHIFEMNDVAERNLALQTLMGRGWQTNVESLKLLAEQGYGPAIEQAKKFGLFFDEEAARKAKAFQVEWEQIKLTLESVAMIGGQKVIPFFSNLMQFLLVMSEYLPQVGKGLADLVNMDSAALTRDILAWKSFGDVMESVYNQINSVVAASAKTGDIGEHLGIKDKDAEERAKKITAILAKAQVDRAKVMEEIDKKATDQLERRDDVEMTRIQARDAIIAKAKVQMAKTMEDLDKTQTDRAVKRNDEAWTKITAREEIVLRARRQMAKTMEDLDKQQTDESVRLNNQKYSQQTRDINTALRSQMATMNQLAGVARNAFALMSSSASKWADVALQAITQVIGAMIQKSAQEQQDVITYATLHAAKNAAQAFEDLGDFNFWAAAKHSAAAVAFGGLAAAPIAVGVAGAAGNSARTGDSFSSGSSAGAAGKSGPIHMAPGAGGGRSMGGTVHVIVSSSDRDLANHIGTLLTNNVRHGGGQLVASKLVGQ